MMDDEMKLPQGSLSQPGIDNQTRIRAYLPGLALGVVFLAGLMAGILALYQDAMNRTAVPGAVEGTLDLRGWDWKEKPLAALDGRWEFYPGQLLTPEDLAGDGAPQPVMDKVPEPWEKAKGFGTYHLRIDLSAGSPRVLALRFPSISSSYRFFVNGEELRTAGRPASSAEDYRGRYYPGLELVPADSTLDLVLQTANYVLEEGGVRNSLVLGRVDVLSRRYHQVLALDFFLLGSCLIMAFYHFFMYLFRRRQREFLTFALMCLVLGLRLLIHNEHYFYQMTPLWDLRIYAGFQVATFYGWGGLLIYFFHGSFPGRLSLPEVRFWGGLTLLSVAMGFLVPYSVQFQWMHLVQILLLGMVLRFLYILGLEIRGGNLNALFVFAGILFLFGFGVHDILLTFGVIRGRMIFHLGFFFYILLHSGGLSWANAAAFHRSERNSEQLRRVLREREALQRNLEVAVEEKSLDLRTAVQELKTARDEADRANEAKSRFLANVSHELRTPLNGVIGFTEILQEIDPTPEQQEYQALVLQESRTMLDLINELLDLSKIEDNQFRLHWEPFSWEEIRRWLDGSMRARTERRGLSFVLTWDDALPAVSRGDVRRLRQVLNNLIGNAVKFTPEGEVRVLFRREEGSPDPGGNDRADRGPRVRIEVKDTGIGIPENAREKIFEPFFQLDRGHSRIFQGTGLGTTISRMLVEMMGGAIGIAESSGEGSTFYCLIPLVEEQDAAEAAETAEGEAREIVDGEGSTARPLAGRKVLVAEDYPMNQRVVLWHLHHWGAETVTAENGLEAVEAFDDSVDLVLMDVQMPVMDGLQAAELLRSEQAARVPIIGLTANAYESDRRDCARAGMDELFPKPVRRKTFLECLLRHLGGSSPEEAPGAEAAAEAEAEGDPGAGNPVLEWEGLCAEMGAEQDFCRELVQNYLDQSRRRLDALEAAESPARERVHRDFHTLKGGALNVMAPAAAAAAQEAEAFYKQLPLEESFSQQERLAVFIRQLRRELDRLEGRLVSLGN